MNILAIDPGALGGIVAIPSGEELKCSKMPETDGDIFAYILSCCKSGEPNGLAVIEKVGGFAGEGQPGSAMFNFGDGYGFIRGILTTLGFKIVLLRPQEWQKILGLGHCEHAKCLLKKNMAGYAEEKKLVNSRNYQYKKEWKNKLKERAQQLYPSLKVTLNFADALLLLEAAKRINLY